MKCGLTHRRRREAFAVIAGQDFLVRLVVVGEAEVGFEEVASEWFVTLSVSAASAPE